MLGGALLVISLLIVGRGGLLVISGSGFLIVTTLLVISGSGFLVVTTLPVIGGLLVVVAGLSVFGLLVFFRHELLGLLVPLFALLVLLVPLITLLALLVLLLTLVIVRVVVVFNRDEGEVVAASVVVSVVLACALIRAPGARRVLRGVLRRAAA
jgi:hypothetical protein